MTESQLMQRCDQWKPILHVAKAHGFETPLVNAKDVKHLPGRPQDRALRTPASPAATRRNRARAPQCLAAGHHATGCRVVTMPCQQLTLGRLAEPEFDYWSVQPPPGGCPQAGTQR
jgi:hypothetical protein